MHAVLLSLLATTGCSLAFVHGPAADRNLDEPPSCTEVPVLPVIETIVAVLAGTSAYAIHRDIGTSSTEDPLPLVDDDAFRRTGRNLLVAGTLIELGSAIYGFVQTSRCHSAKAAYARHVTM